jgi:hypothetical protein
LQGFCSDIFERDNPAFHFKQTFQSISILCECVDGGPRSTFPLARRPSVLSHHPQKWELLAQMSTMPYIGLSSQLLKGGSSDSGRYVKFTTTYIVVGMKGGILMFWSPTMRIVTGSEERERKRKQAGAELCQAQFKLG